MDITLQNVKRKFNQWRSAKKTNHKREKIPEELLQLASDCGVKFGVTVTVKMLGLNSLKLKSAMQSYPQNCESEEGKNPNKAENNPVMDFIEATFPQTELKNEPILQSSKAECHRQLVLYELENRFGAKMRVFSESERIQKDILSVFSLGV